MTNRITVGDLVDHPIADVVQDAGVRVLVKQSWWDRRKNSITAVAQVVLQVANLAAGVLLGAPWWVTLIVAVLVGVAEVAVHAGTRGAVTPSVVSRIRAESEQVQGRIRRTVEDITDGLPVYRGPTSAGQ